MKENTLPAAQALLIHALITPTEQGIASRVVARTDGGNVTLFAFDQGQGLSEHSAPYDALVMVLEGELLLTIGGEPVVAQPGTLVRMPANIPHAVEAQQSSRMLLTMLKTLKTH